VRFSTARVFFRRTAAALMAARGLFPERDDVTLSAKRARNSLQFNWPKIDRNIGEHAVSLPSA